MNAPSVMLAENPPETWTQKQSGDCGAFEDVQQKYDQTLIIITHDENIALQADRIIAIEDGRITRDERTRN